MTTEEHFVQVTESVETKALRDLEVLQQYAELRKPVRGLSGLLESIGETVGKFDWGTDANS